ncbi:hypothetical protein H072_9933 [Dactylellina haptotyla CBS 200.50]|uniref:HMG box domain-containing protein n=1 Tax=Dactylellina haptotyla (strain CBS 200.50) TaxID=1284197 RepID=S8BBJ1_DACHA|nr:hypothetical protein H072_9933 [Dactylellina haptotyla CBS 200.50]
MAQNPGKSNPAISKVIGEMWKNASEDTRKEWQNHADEEKRQHMLRYPDYRYQPRRSGKKGSGSSTSPSDSTGPSRCQKCGGKTGAYSTTDSPSFPILPVPTVSAPGLSSRGGSIRELLGPSPSLFSRHASPSDHKRKRSDEVGYHHGAEALLQLGSHDRDYPSRSMAPPTSTTRTNTTVKSGTEKSNVENGHVSPPRAWKRKRTEETIREEAEEEEEADGAVVPHTSAINPNVNAITSRTATSPAMSYQSSSELPLSGERRASDPTNYRQLQPRYETFSSPDYLEPHNYTSSPHTHMQHRSPTGAERQHHQHQQPTSTPTLEPTEKIQQIQRITRPLSNRSSSSRTGAVSPSSLAKMFLISVEVTDQRLATELCYALHSELLERSRNVLIHQLMDVPEWQQFLQRSSAAGPEDLASDYLRAVAAARRQFEAIFMTAAAGATYEHPGTGSGPSSSSSPWDQRLAGPGAPPAQFRPPPSLTIAILQQYILTHSGTARRRLSPNGNVSPVYTSEWCIDVWRGSPRPNVTIYVRNDDGLGMVNIENPSLGIVSVPAPTNGEGRPWKANVIRRLAFEINEYITGLLRNLKRHWARLRNIQLHFLSKLPLHILIDEIAQIPILQEFLTH